MDSILSEHGVVLMVVENTQRVKLVYTIKFLLLVVMVWLIWVFVSASVSFRNAAETRLQSLDISALRPGGIAYYKVGRRQLLVLHRNKQMIDCLQSNATVLYDPDSRYSRQPATLAGRFRSQTPDYFIAYAQEPDMGCPVEFIGADGLSDVPVLLWCGGFRDVCQGSYYDLAGRVYAGQRGVKNLVVPEYQHESNRFLIQIITEE